MQIILQPAGGQEAQLHFRNTIMRPLRIDDVRFLISEPVLRTLERKHPDGNIGVWGVTPGSGGGNVNRWNRMHEGDLVLFAGSNRIFASGFLTEKTHNRDLAVKLWGRSEVGSTWEYVYFLGRVKGQSVSYAEMNRILGYAPRYIVRGVNIIDSRRTVKFLRNFPEDQFGYLPR